MDKIQTESRFERGLAKLLRSTAQSANRLWRRLAIYESAWIFTAFAQHRRVRTFEHTHSQLSSVLDLVAH